MGIGTSVVEKTRTQEQTQKAHVPVQLCAECQDPEPIVSLLTALILHLENRENGDGKYQKLVQANPLQTVSLSTNTV